MAYVEVYRKEQYKELVGQSGDVLYVGCGPLGASDALKLQMKLQRILGPAILALAGGKTSIKELMNDKQASFAIINTLKEMDIYESDILNIIGKFCEKTQYSFDGETWIKKMGAPGTPGQNNFDNVFLGNLDIMFQWLFFHLQINFKNFLESMKHVSVDVDRGEKSQKDQE